MNKSRNLIEKLAAQHTLTADEYKKLLLECTPEDKAYLTFLAKAQTEQIYGRDIYIRGLIEISNICRNDCYYCGIRASNQSCSRYRLTEEDILLCCEEGYQLGFRTFVLQGGEDGYFTDERLCYLIREIKKRYHDCAVTLSLGERTRESYALLKEAGADRYLLRHETADPLHYAKLHPENLSWAHRMDCLHTLRALHYQVGCGFMVGSPYQTVDMLAEELKFIERFKPDMCGIGPFIPHEATAFRAFPPGNVETTCTLLSLIRLIHPNVLLPATTALGTLFEHGREKGILAGANVIMPNLSPVSVRNKYMLYDNKRSDGDESAEALAVIKQKMQSIGFNIVTSRGDVKNKCI